jgi:type I restriction enzyme, S subunit
MNRKPYQLDDVFDVINGGAWTESEYVESGIHVVKVTNMINDTIKKKDDNYLPKSKYEKYKKHKLFEGDIVVATVGSHPTQQGSVVGRTSIIPKKFDGSFLNQNVACLRIKRSDLVSVKYFNYITKTILFKHHIESRAKGSANQVRMAIGDLKKFTHEYPSLNIQKKIAAVLLAYDDLIENNSRRITILEKMAEEIYKEWFVRMRFPGHQTTKFKKGIPAGWEVKKLNEFCEKVTDGTYDTPKPTNEGFYLITGKHLKNGTVDFNDAYKISEQDHISISKRSGLQKGDILFSNIGTLGSMAIVGDNIGYSVKNVIIFKPEDQFQSVFLYYMLNEKYVLEQLLMRSSGASQQFISLGVARNFPVLNPISNLIDKFGELVKSTHNEKMILVSKNLNLKQTRDCLLTRLISGKLSVENLDIQFPPSMKE